MSSSERDSAWAATRVISDSADGGPGTNAPRDSGWAATRVLGDRSDSADGRPGTNAPRDSGWAPTRVLDDRAGLTDGWQETRAQTAIATQILRDKDEYLEGAARDIGRQIGANERELFVSCDPGPALQQQFDHLHPEFITVHDLATTSSRRLLASVAGAAGRAVQKLIIRRQGYGTPLATIEYVEVPTNAGGTLRIYTTECDADTTSRQAIARTLLGYSRLGVVMVGELPPHALDAAFRALRDDMLAHTWHNRDVLLLPLTTSGAVAAMGVELSRATPVAVRTTPLVARPADAWDFISGTWGRLRESAGGGRPAAPPRPMPAAAPAITQLTMRPMPPVPTAADRAASIAAAPQTLLGRYALRVSELTGVVSCSVFDVAQARDLAHAGSGHAPADLAQQGAELLATLTATSRSMGFGHATPEAAITLGTHHLLLRPVPRHPGVALHAVLDKAQANLTLARLQVARLDAMFDDPGA